MKYKYEKKLMNLRIFLKLLFITILSLALVASSLASFYLFIRQLYIAIMVSALSLFLILYLYIVDLRSLIKEGKIELTIESTYFVFNKETIKFEDVTELKVYKHKNSINRITIECDDHKYKIYKLEGYGLDKLVALIVGGSDERRL